MVLAFISAYQGPPLLTTDLLIEDTHPDFAQTGPKKSSIIKLVTVDTAIALGELGELSVRLLQQADEKLGMHWSCRD